MRSDPRPDGQSDGKGRVLLVDDDPGVLLTLAHTLEQAGHQVEAITEGESALNLLARQSFEVVISDIGLPGMDGLQLLGRVREQDLDVPVVLMTGLPTVETAIHAVDQGALHYLVKPFPTSVLIDLVARAMQLRKLALLKREAMVFVADEAKPVGDRAGLSASLDQALASIWIAYQPIVSVKDGSVFAHEAFLRSDEPTLRNPVLILEAAERLGRLAEIGRAVRDRVAADAPASSSQYFINVHPRDLLDDTLYTPQAPLSRIASRVVLEITERAALDAIADASARITVLRRMGFRVAIDDLGSGYAGLASFAQLAPDVVKFDMSLVRDIDSNSTKRRIVQSMTALFHGMNILVVAEGVESAQECAALSDAGCDLQQGHWFARPARALAAGRMRKEKDRAT